MNEQVSSKDIFWIAIYCWIITLFGAVFMGHEIAVMNHRMDQDSANSKLMSCNRILSGYTNADFSN